MGCEPELAEQGITIDVAYRYFQYLPRRILIARLTLAHRSTKPETMCERVPLFDSQTSAFILSVRQPRACFRIPGAITPRSLSVARYSEPCFVAFINSFGPVDLPRGRVFSPVARGFFSPSRLPIGLRVFSGPRNAQFPISALRRRQLAVSDTGQMPCSWDPRLILKMSIWKPWKSGRPRFVAKERFFFPFQYVFARTRSFFFAAK